MTNACTQYPDRTECNENNCCLNKKKTRLIPFDWEKYKAGARAVMMDGDLIDTFIILSITHSNLAENKPINVIYYYNTNKDPISCHMQTNIKGFQLDCDGTCYPKCGHDKPDLMLIEELEEKTFYVNVYPECVCHGTFDTIEEANEIANIILGRLGMLKITYTEEDLIK